LFHVGLPQLELDIEFEEPAGAEHRDAGHDPALVGFLVQARVE
jgi:hypothetical protein